MHDLFQVLLFCYGTDACGPQFDNLASSVSTICVSCMGISERIERDKRRRGVTHFKESLI